MVDIAARFRHACRPARVLLRFFTSPRLALGVLGFIAIYSALSVWLPEPFLKRALGGQPFSSCLFLLACTFLFVSTAACTWMRTGKVWAQWAGRLPAPRIQILSPNPETLNRFLALQGFAGRGRIRWRNRFALLAGWLLHLALLVLMAGVLIQLSFHDGGAFELVEGEWVRLSDPRAVFDRQQGPLAPAEPPPLRIGLLNFDPYQHQMGYAPDRRSRLRVELPSGVVREFMLDRVEGARVGNVVLYQAVPSGLALVLEVEGAGLRAIHLRTLGKRVATARVTDPKGRSFYFEVDSERDIDNRRGTGALKIIVANESGERRLAVGDIFDFGFSGARLVDVARWSGHTYSRSPGMPAVFCGFALVLAASFLLAFPAGIAHVERRSHGVRARIWLNRGSKVVLSDWEDFQREATRFELKEAAQNQRAALGET